MFAIKVIEIDELTNKVSDKYLSLELDIVERVKHEFIMKTHRVIKHENKYVL